MGLPFMQLARCDRVDATHAFFPEVLTGHGCFCTEGGVMNHNVAPQGNQVTSIRLGEAITLNLVGMRFDL